MWKHMEVRGSTLEVCGSTVEVCGIIFLSGSRCTVSRRKLNNGVAQNSIFYGSDLTDNKYLCSSKMSSHEIKSYFSELLELVYTDFCGAMDVKSIFLTFLDDFIKLKFIS